MSIDENGTHALDQVQRAVKTEVVVDERYRRLVMTGVVLRRATFPDTRTNITSLKEKYWEDGLFNYKKHGHRRVCFHSREIRKREGPFGCPDLPYDHFVSELWEILNDVPATVFSCAIDKLGLVKQYAYPEHPYALSFKYILERFCGFLRERGATGIVLLEARGEREDAEVLQHALAVLEKGTTYHPAAHFQCIKGIYFNPKWNDSDDGLTSYLTLEIADLWSYPIFQFVRDGAITKEFGIVGRKLYRYPAYEGYGLKRFPHH